MSICVQCGSPAEFAWSFVRSDGVRQSVKICSACMAPIWAKHSASHVGQTSTFEELSA
jgi:hypothetical protein